MSRESQPGEGTAPVHLGRTGIQLAQVEEAVEHRPHARHPEDLTAAQVVGQVDHPRPVNPHRGGGQADAAVHVARVVQGDAVHDRHAEPGVADVALVLHDLDQRLVEGTHEQESATRLLLLLTRLALLLPLLFALAAALFHTALATLLTLVPDPLTVQRVVGVTRLGVDAAGAPVGTVVLRVGAGAGEHVARTGRGHVGVGRWFRIARVAAGHRAPTAHRLVPLFDTVGAVAYHRGPPAYRVDAVYGCRLRLLGGARGVAAGLRAHVDHAQAAVAHESVPHRPIQ